MTEIDVKGIKENLEKAIKALSDEIPNLKNDLQHETIGRRDAYRDILRYIQSIENYNEIMKNNKKQGGN